VRRLDGKRVLLVAPRFFGYEVDIRSELERRGAQVDWLPDRPFDAPIMMALTRLNTQWVLPLADQLYNRLLCEIGSSHYNTILVVNGQTLSVRILKALRSRFPNAKFVLYMWDSMENRSRVVGNLPLFDEAYSFDPESARYYGMRLRPLFFSKGFERPYNNNCQFDVSFVGTAHTDRYEVVSKLRRSLPSGLSCYWYLFLQAPWVYYIYRLSKPSMRRAKRDEFQFVPLDKSKLESIFSCSRAILDIEHPCQRGLTMRTFETMGSHKKLITTNKQVRDYDFFNEDNICVVDRNAPQVSVKFLESPFVPIPAEIYQRYSIEGWVDEVLGLVD